MAFIFYYLPISSNGKLGSEVTPVQLNESTMLYRPPLQHAPEFEVRRTRLARGGSAVLEDSGAASIVLIVKGVCDLALSDETPLTDDSAPELYSSVSSVAMGSVIFVSANHSVRVSAVEDVELFRAHINLA